MLPNSKERTNYNVKILFIGDIFGRPGRRAVRNILPRIKDEYGVELFLANGENAAGGIGITPPLVDEICSYGVDLITTGNHIWQKKEILDIIDTDARIIRPANYPPDAPGRSSSIIDLGGARVGVINLCGRVFMGNLDCPFRAADREIEKLRDVEVIIVDFHAEGTSEKVAMGWYLDGRVSAVIGTHTHVQTADERILPKGTAYITDVGMTGPHDSVIGVRIDLILHRFLTQMPVRFEPAKENVILCGVIIEVDPKLGKALSIQRLRLPLNS